MAKVLTSNSFTISSEIKEKTFHDNKFLSKVERNLGSLNSNLFDIDQATFLKDVFFMGHNLFDEMTKQVRSDDLSIHRKYLSWIRDYYKFLSELDKSQLHPYCPILNSHPLESRGNTLYIKRDLLRACTSERKRDISSAYGEGIGILLLRNYENVNSYGVLKIHTGKGSTPDFILIDENKKIVLLSEIKSTINYKAGNPRDQLLNYKNNYDCLGVQVIFNKGESPVEIVLSDPEYKLEGSIFPAIYSNLAVHSVIRSIYEAEDSVNIIGENDSMFNQFINIAGEYDLSNLDLSNIVKGNSLYTANETGDHNVDDFLTDYFKMNGSNIFLRK